MTIASLDYEVAGIIKDKHICGLEAIINSIVRAVIDEPYVDPEYIKKLVDAAYEREKEELKHEHNTSL